MEKLNKSTAQRLLEQTTTAPHLLQHALSVSVAMGAMAEFYGEDIEYWQAVGLLHDYDYEQFPDEHLSHTKEPLEAAGVDDDSIRAILSHGWELCSEVEPVSLLEKSLFAVDEMTGLISATAKMRPTGIADLEAKSVKKKFKDKSFAAKIDREVIIKGAEMLGIELGQLIELCITGMRPYAAELSLLGSDA